MRKQETQIDSCARRPRIPAVLPRSLSKGQRGFTLLLGMILILVMTVFGVFAMNNSIMQARMAANYQDKKVAFEAAEMGLRWGEAWLQSRLPTERPFPCQADTAALASCDRDDSVLLANVIPYNIEDEYPGAGIWADFNLKYGFDPSDKSAAAQRVIPAVVQQPSLLLEEAFVDRDDLAGDPQRGRVFYRVLSASTGELPGTVVVLESTVAKRYQ